MTRNRICIWYDKEAEAAARFYAVTFPDSHVTAVIRAPAIIPPAGPVMFWWSNSPSPASPAWVSTAGRG